MWRFFYRPVAASLRAARNEEGTYGSSHQSWHKFHASTDYTPTVLIQVPPTVRGFKVVLGLGILPQGRCRSTAQGSTSSPISNNGTYMRYKTVES